MAKRRANGEGNLRKRKDGRWEGRYTAGHDPETGKAIYRNVLGRTQAEARAKLKQAIEEAKIVDQTKAKKYTVGEWMDVWFENYAKVKVRPPVPPDLPGIHRQPHQAQHREDLSEQTHFPGATEVLQKAAQQRQNGENREQETEQGAKP